MCRPLPGRVQRRGATATLDDVVARLDALERNNASSPRKTRNCASRSTISQFQTGAHVRSPRHKGQSGSTCRLAPSPAPEHAVVSIGGAPIYSKAPGGNAFIDNTTVTLYGHVDLSGDIFNAGVSIKAPSRRFSYLTFFGVRARHDPGPYGLPGWAAVTIRVAGRSGGGSDRARGVRHGDSFIGMEFCGGTIKAGKSDRLTRKRLQFDPFSATLGDYNSIMGNTGGDLRAEFDWRAAHAIWYESPIWNGLRAPS